ncbi:MAG TPA: phosphotransferase [Tepidisphaeraceae bacterium]|jgi:tRNA A-37 threonylcarbamoyl transferase component Bud32|nr:phosphotransferase [Tepidisphaeraceae bacterium]
MSVDIEQPDQLLTYLKQTNRISPTEIPQIQILRGGVSNKTVLVKRSNNQSWVLKQALPKLRVEVDWFSDPARIHREALALKILPSLSPPNTITPLIFEDPANHLLAMQAVDEPHDNLKTLFMSAQIDPNHLQQFGHIIGVIHSNSTGRSDLAQLFDDRSFFESLRIEPYYRYTAQQVPQAASTLNHLIQTTHSRRLCLVHGDYSPKNILVNNHKLILLDHEVIHFGDPAFDLGFALAHLLSKAHHFPAQRLAFAAATQTFWTSYTNAIQSAPWRTDIESHAAFHAVACLLARVAGRSKLEYLTQEERQKQMNLAIHLLQSRPTSIDELLNRFLSQL